MSWLLTFVQLIQVEDTRLVVVFNWMSILQLKYILKLVEVGFLRDFFSLHLGASMVEVFLQAGGNQSLQGQCFPGRHSWQL